MGRAYLPSCPNFSEDGDRWPSPCISILNKGVGRVVTSCHSIEGCSSLDSVVLPSGLQSLAFDNVLSQTVPPLGLHSLTFSNSFDQRLDNMTLP
jgi:hypothetical protein